MSVDSNLWTEWDVGIKERESEEGRADKANGFVGASPGRYEETRYLSRKRTARRL